MGSWNGTDGLTQLPIMAGDKVKFIILIDSLVEDGHCYPTCFYTPIYLPISGEYDDYGCIDNIVEDKNTEYIVNYFNKQVKDGLVNIDEHYIKYDHEGDKENITFTIQTLVRAIERCALKMKDRYGGTEFAKVTFMMVLDPVWKEATTGYEKWMAEEKEKTLSYIAFNSRRKAIEKLLDKDYKPSPANAKLLADSAIELSTISKKYDYRNMPRWIHSSPSFMWINDNIVSNPKPFVDRIVEFMALGLFMLTMRKCFAPQTGSGSQQQGYETYVSFYSKVIKITEDLIKKEKEEMEKY